MVHIIPPGDRRHDFVIKKDSVQPNLDVTLEDDDDNVIDLVGASVRFRMKKPGADSLKIDETATLLDAANGRVEYDWSSGDTDTAGHYNAEFAVDYSGETGQDFDPDEFIPSDRFLDVYINTSL